MPRVCDVDPAFWSLLAAQDYVVHRDQALGHGMTRHVFAHRVATHGWQRLVGCVYLAHPGEPSRRQLRIAALLYAGPESAIDDVDACRFHGLSCLPLEALVYVVAPFASPARSSGFVRVRRTTSPFTVVRTDRLRYVEPAVAVISACRRRRSGRSVLAAVSEAVQRGLCSSDDLLRAHVQGSPRNASATDAAIARVRSGIRSAPEGDWQLLARASLALPPLVYNCLLRLPDGICISPDALAVDAGLVHETNGRKAHARLDLFEDMQQRHNVMTAAGLIVMHNSPARLRSNGRAALVEFERAYLKYRGRGLPPGVEVTRLAG